jgi:SAM-dependent methyltransferase
LKDKLLNYIYSKNPAQKKKLEKVLTRNTQMAADLDSFLKRYESFMRMESITTEQLADAYLLMIAQVMQSRLEFIRTGAYPIASAQEAFQNVYDNKKVMTQYMLGLALSQFLWEHHYNIFQFFSQKICQAPHKQNFLEVGSGHGLYLLKILDTMKDFNTFDVVDISDASLGITQNIITALKPDCRTKVNFIKADINLFDSSRRYDFIAMGEVLEHVEDPAKILRSLNNLSAPEGCVYISTCANCPAIDHVFHFKNIQEVRTMLRSAGFEIEHEIVAPSENKTPEQIEAMKIDVTYAAILRKGN